MPARKTTDKAAITDAPASTSPLNEDAARTYVENLEKRLIKTDAEAREARNLGDDPNAGRLTREAELIHARWAGAIQGIRSLYRETDLESPELPFPPRNA